MATAADQYILEKSYAPQKQRTPFVRKQLMYANDVNNGQYSQGGSVVFDLSSFANVQNGFLNLSDGTLQIPLCITASLPDNQAIGAASAGNYCLDNFIALKNGSWSIINSISVNYDGIEVVQPNNFSNSFISYKVLSTWTTDDVNNFGASCLFAKDSSNSWVYNNADVAASATADSRLNQGNGICNNMPFSKVLKVPDAVTRQDGDFDAGNEGLYKRLGFINHRPSVAPNTTALVSTDISQNLSAIRNNNNFDNELQNWTQTYNAGNGSTTFFQQWFVMATIPLKNLSSFFENMPLVKGAYLKMNITLNTGSVVVNTKGTRVANTPAQYCNLSDINFSYTNPLIICERPPIANAASDAASALVGPKHLVSIGVVQAPSTSVSGFTSHNAKGGRSHALTSCRVTLPVLELKAAENEAYIKANQSKYVEWEDIYATQIQDVKANGNFNFLVSNGTVDAIGLLMIPMIGSSANGKLINANTLANTGFSPAISPFTSEPMTPSPISLTQLQVMHGSQNILSPFISYGYEEFLFQLNEAWSLNGNKATGLASGLISQADWENLYRYYWVTLDRGNDSEAKVPKSISIMGYNNSQVNVDILVYVVTRKGFVIDCTTGRVVKDLRAA